MHYPAAALTGWPNILLQASVKDLTIALAGLSAERCTDTAPLIDQLLNWAAFDASSALMDLVATLSISLEDSLATAIPQQVMQEELTQKLFNLDVCLNILYSIRNPSNPKFVSIFVNLQKVANDCKASARRLRERIAILSHDLSLLSFEAVSVCQMSVSDIQKLRDRAAMHLATTHDPVARAVVSREQNVLEQELEYLQLKLTATTLLEWRIVQGLGLLYLHRGLSVSVFTAGVHWLVDMLTETHRGVRASVRDALVRIVVAQAKELASACMSPEAAVEALVLKGSHTGDDGTGVSHCRNAADIHKTLCDLLVLLIDELRETQHQLYRRKVDLIVVASYMLRYCARVPLRKEIVAILIQLFDSPDTVARNTAIELIEFLGRARLPQVTDLLANPRDAHSLQALISVRMQNPGYRSKKQLGQLQQWLLSCK